MFTTYTNINSLKLEIVVKHFSKVMGARLCDYRSRKTLPISYNYNIQKAVCVCVCIVLDFTKTVVLVGYIDVKQQEPNKKLQNRVDVNIGIDSWSSIKLNAGQ